MSRLNLHDSIQSVINWLENGCDPKSAVVELKLLQERIRYNFSIEHSPVSHAIEGAYSYGLDNSNPAPDDHPLKKWWVRGNENYRLGKRNLELFSAFHAILTLSKNHPENELAKNIINLCDQANIKENYLRNG